MQILVTVGTTKFQDLIDLVSDLEFLSLIVAQGYGKLVVQYGSSLFRAFEHPGLAIETYDFKPSIADDIQNSQLIISSGGAGTILEVLEFAKPLLVVYNTTLQGNHQLDLSQELSVGGYLESCYCDGLIATLSKPRLELKEWPKVDGASIITKVIEELCE